MYTPEDIEEITKKLLIIEDSGSIQEHFNSNGSDLTKFIEQTDGIELASARIFIKVCEIYAYYGKIAEVRALVTQDNDIIFSDLTTFYRKAKKVLAVDESLCKEALNLEIQFHRALGNLTIDDDSSRRKILDIGIMREIIEELETTRNDELRKIRTGCLLNISLGFSPARKEFLNQDCFRALLSSLSIDRLKAKEFATVYLCLELLSNLFEEETCSKLFSESYSNIQELVKTLEFYKLNSGEFDIPILTHLVEAMEASLNDNETIHPTLASDGTLEFLCDFLAISNNISGRYPQNKKELGSVFTIVERIIVLVSSHNDNLQLFDDSRFMQRLSEWLVQTEDPQLSSCAALVLGNLARTDQNCTRMVQELQLHLKLVPLLERSMDLSLQHAIVGVLKNLSIPVENKRILGTSKLIQLVSPLLEKQTAQPLQFGVAGLLKHLSNRNNANSLAMCALENGVDGVLPISHLRNVIQKTDHQGIKSEATRALMNIVKAVYSTNEAFEKFGNIITDNTAVQPVMDLVMQTKFPILQNEAIITLALLSSIQSPDVEAMVLALIESPSEFPKTEDGVLTEKDALEMVPFSQAIGDILLASSRPYATEMRMNVMAFIEQVFKYCMNLDPTNLEKLRAKCLPVLTSLLSEKDDSLRLYAEKIRENYF